MPKPGAASPYASRHYLLTEETLRHVVFGDPGYDLHSFNFDTDLPALQVASAQIDPDNPDLSVFNGRHGKLIMSVGWSDWAVGGLIVKGFYDQIVAKNGGQARTGAFARRPWTRRRRRRPLLRRWDPGSAWLRGPRHRRSRPPAGAAS